ncbi:MAG: hypothetical protein QXM43_08765 [Desulfurococcaceae archaeon]
MNKLGFKTAEKYTVELTTMLLSNTQVEEKKKQLIITSTVS